MEVERGRRRNVWPNVVWVYKGNTIVTYSGNLSTKFHSVFVLTQSVFVSAWLYASFNHYRLATHGVGTSCCPVLICWCCCGVLAEDELADRILVLGSL